MRLSALAAVAALAGVVAAPAPVVAASDRPITLVVPFSPGGAPDAGARLIAPRMSEQLGGAVVVDNKPGAGGQVGTAFVAKSRSDGYTLLMGTAANAIAAAYMKDLPYDFEKDLLPVAQIATVPGVLIVAPQMPAKNVPELITYLRAHPDRVTYGSPGIGTSVHMAGELFQYMTKTKMLHVPYRGAANAMVDILGGQVDLMFPALAAALPHIKAGKVRVLGVTTKDRTQLAPDIPAVRESLPNYEVGAWIGLFAAKGTSDAAIERLHAAVAKSIVIPEMRELMMRGGFEPVNFSQAEFRELVGREIARWTKVIKAANIHPE
jgi:tripartite-type tricarboxylate transporter receptor subunit TctC